MPIDKKKKLEQDNLDDFASNHLYVSRIKAVLYACAGLKCRQTSFETRHKQSCHNTNRLPFPY